MLLMEQILAKQQYTGFTVILISYVHVEYHNNLFLSLYDGCNIVLCTFTPYIFCVWYIV